MCYEDGSGIRGYGRFDLRQDGVVCRNIHVHEDGDEVVQDDRVEGRGKSGGYGDHFITGLEAPRTQKRGSESGQGQEIGGRTGIGQTGVFYADLSGQFGLKFLRETAFREPEVKRGLDSSLNFFLIENASSIADRGFSADEFLLCVSCLVKLRHKRGDLLPEVRFGHCRYSHSSMRMFSGLIPLPSRPSLKVLIMAIGPDK